MSRVKILVEGQTEESFVNQVLYPHLIGLGVILTPILLKTKRVKNRNRYERSLPGRRFKGGISRYAPVKQDIRNVLRDQTAFCTTMIDFYGLPDDFPGMDNLPAGNSYDHVSHLESALADDIGTQRFRPFLVLHEYEALLFSNPVEIAKVFPDQNVLDPLTAIRRAFVSPEDINQGSDTHPAARIKKHVVGYKKVVHGTLIAQRIGLQQMRQTCPHFNDWISWLESLAYN